MQRAEKIAAFLAALFAAIGWLVQVLAEEVAAGKVIGYRIETATLGDKTRGSITIENVSRVNYPGPVDVYLTFLPNTTCAPGLLDDSGKPILNPPAVSITPIGTSHRRQADEDAPGRNTYKATFNKLAPGSAYEITSTYPPNCELQLSIDTKNNDVRIIPFGLETALVKNRFSILLVLLGLAMVAVAVVVVKK